MTWLVAATTGASVGIAYFGGLWLTVRRVAQGPRPILFVLSRVARLALVAGVFYGLSREGADMVLAGLSGLWLARWLLIRQLGGLSHAR
jgi:F1F0 ATPase subunit 2